MRNLLIIVALFLSFTSSVYAQNTSDTQRPSTQSETQHSAKTQYDSLFAYYFAAARTNDTAVIEHSYHLIATTRIKTKPVKQQSNLHKHLVNKKL